MPNFRREIERKTQLWKIILKWVLRNNFWSCKLDSSDSEQILVAGSCLHGDEPSYFMWGEEFRYSSRNCCLLKKNSVECNQFALLVPTNNPFCFRYSLPVCNFRENKAIKLYSYKVPMLYKSFPYGSAYHNFLIFIYCWS